MKITKFIHSCLLVEGEKNVLIDPGVYSSESINIDKLPNLDFILITHEHPDHLDQHLVQRINSKFPDVQIISNQSVSSLIPGVVTKGNSSISIEEVPHEKVFGTDPPANLLFNVFGKLTHPGDSFHFSLKTDILAMPLQAPWGSLTEAVAKIEELKPKFVLPIHDWHWNDEARIGLYKRLEEYLAAKDIKFIPLETGNGVDINLL